jgi:hypothetical protein
VIYFAQTPTGSIKIGHTKKLTDRLRELEDHYGASLMLLGTKIGGRAMERKLHSRFASLRLGRTEQFRPGPKLMAFIGSESRVPISPDRVITTPPYGDRVVRINPYINREYAAVLRELKSLEGGAE